MQKKKKMKTMISNRELSWIKFNNRVLAEAQDKSLPLLERALTLSFVSSNEAEFFMVRVASNLQSYKKAKTEKDKKKYSKLLKDIRNDICDMDETQDSLVEEITELLIKKNLIIHTKIPDDETLAKWCYDVFSNRISPLLTPMAIMPNRPFPLIKGKSLNIAAVLNDQPGSWATIKLPDSLPRMMIMPSNDNRTHIILLETLVLKYLEQVFGGRKVRYSTCYRLIRNAEAEFTDVETGDFLSSVRGVLQKRKRGRVVRLDMPEKTAPQLVSMLSDCFKVTPEKIYKHKAPLNIASMMKSLYSVPGFEELRYKKYIPRLPQRILSNDLFTEIAKKDILLFHPYDSFDPIVIMIEKASQDPQVLAIKQTLYRVSGDSPIIAALIAAAKAGKQVTVFIEIKARFDEQNNILCGELMERAGCQVLYGISGLKTHSKITLIVRQEEELIRNYLHLGTGNYHDITAKSYTDLSLLTADEKLGNDAVQFFHILTGYGNTTGMNSLIAAPDTLRDKLTALIRTETQNAKAGLPARIDGKMNALVDKKIIAELYKASCAGVKINLIVRSACCLIPGVPNLSENISVISIVGRHLEHARIFRFENACEPKLFLSSADWMPRNLDKRVELMFPIKDNDIKERIENILKLQQADNVKASKLNNKGIYEPLKTKAMNYKLNAQEVLMRTHGWTNETFNIEEYVNKVEF